MKRIPEWLYDEAKIAGTDFADPAEVAAYEERSRTQDRRALNDAIMQYLELDSSKIVLDLGAGFGSFALAAASRCEKVIAVDISSAMLDRAAKTAEEMELSNIEFRVAGFLTYEHTGPPADAIVCSGALHHLPDFWKQIALNRMSAMLKPDGKLHLEDHVISFDPHTYAQAQDDLIARNKDSIRSDGRSIMAGLIREEFPTYDWIMESMIERAGFAIVNKRYGRTGFRAFYQCRKPAAGW